MTKKAKRQDLTWLTGKGVDIDNKRVIINSLKKKKVERQSKMKRGPVLLEEIFPVS